MLQGNVKNSILGVQWTEHQPCRGPLNEASIPCPRLLSTILFAAHTALPTLSPQTCLCLAAFQDPFTTKVSRSPCAAPWTTCRICGV
jgi:hypothetical protein